MTTHATGVCPKCDGTTRMPVPEEGYDRAWLPQVRGYDLLTDTFVCDNCGGQTMSGKATGTVPLRPDGTPCVHSFACRPAGRCYREYTCRHCPAKYRIDSGD